MTNANQVNIQDLQSLYSNDPAVKALIDLFAERDRGRNDSTPPRMRRVLRAKGTDLSTKQLSEIMRKLQRMHLGRCVSGRNGKVSRFVWGFHLKSVADVARGGTGQLQPAPRPRVRLPKLEALTAQPAAPAPEPTVFAPPVFEQTQVAPDPRRVIVHKAGFEISLPLDMSEQDWKEAAMFLNNLQSAG